MPSKKRSNGRKRKQGQNALVCSPSAISYNGPSRLPLARGRPTPDDIVIELLIINSVASNGAGVINTVFDSWTQATSANGWSSFSAEYSEARVLSMDLTLTPWNRYNLPTTTVAAPLYVVEDRTTGTALAALTDVSGYDTMQVHPPSTVVNRVMRMLGTAEAEFTSTASSPATTDRMYIKLYSAGNTATTTYYDYVNRILVQFQNRK